MEGTLRNVVETMITTPDRVDPLLRKGVAIEIPTVPA
jgi:hypothetical protein